MFSHAPDPDYVPQTKATQVTESVVLRAPVDDAFDGFTDGVHLWWPVDTESISGPGSHIAFLSEHLVEEAEDGQEFVWADIREWKSPLLIGLEWTLGINALEPLDVEIKFEPADGDTCRVSISYVRRDPVDEDDDVGFVCDWSLILARYTRFMGGALSLD